LRIRGFRIHGSMSSKRNVAARMLSRRYRRVIFPLSSGRWTVPQRSA
jgi:hypothetical protein